jgi:hypothetical protein
MLGRLWNFFLLCMGITPSDERAAPDKWAKIRAERERWERERAEREDAEARAREGADRGG